MAIRTATQRRIDTLETPQRGGDVWVALANTDGTAQLIAASYSWDGERLTVSTRVRSKTGRNLTRAGWARMALDLDTDVVMVEGPLEIIPLDADAALAGAHAATIGFDFRQAPEPYIFFRLTPTRIQAMRSLEEEPERTIMRDGRWLDDVIKT